MAEELWPVEDFFTDLEILCIPALSRSNSGKFVRNNFVPQRKLGIRRRPCTGFARLLLSQTGSRCW